MEKWTVGLERFSIRTKLTLYSCVVFLLVAGVIAASSVSNVRFLRAYSASTAQYRLLSGFYQSMRAANINLTNYCYSRSEEDRQAFQAAYDQAHDCAVQLHDKAESANLRFRFGLLVNMADTYFERFRQLLPNTQGSLPAYSSDYEAMLRLNELIDRTSSDYFSLVTDDMEVRRLATIADWKHQMVLVAVFVGLLIVCAVAFSVHSLRSITRPVGRIIRNIQKIKKGEYDLKEVQGAGPEFAILCEAFNDMAVSVKGNIESIEKNAKLRSRLLETENEKLRIQELLTATELGALQGQINPHFLFNTLSMISQMAYLENAPKTSGLMEITSELLRYSLDKANKITTLTEELECVRNYLDIQRMRFGERVRFELEVEPGAPELKLPGMILQPLIENAVLHGVNGMTEDALVSVSVRRRGNAAVLCVEDNGRGMSGEALESVLRGDPAPSNAGSRGGTNIGVMNVRRRLEMLYGSGCRFQMESSEGCGMLITITIELDGTEEELCIT